MELILLSGGSGKRLWPLSNDVRSKQFLKLFTDGEGNRQSMVQRVYGQIKEVIPEANVTVATNAAQVDSIRSQLGDNVDIVLEPERRDTFPAIALACAYIAFEKGVSLDKVITVLPVDPYTELGYFRVVKRMAKCLENNNADIALMGIKPNIPTSKYGYIIPGEALANEEFSVSKFVEKPDEGTAAKLIENGAFWNGGVFSFKLKYIMDIVKSHIDFSSFGELSSRYGELKKISFDYEVVEKTLRIAMVPFHGMWTDVGTWRTLADEIGTKLLGNVVMEDSRNTYVINEMNVPLITLGTKDLVVAASPDGILVSDLGKSSQLKPIVDKLDSRPMYEERRWGLYKVFDKTIYEDKSQSLIKRISIKSGKSISYQSHSAREEIWVIENGCADFVLEGELKRIGKGDVVKIPKGAKHTICAVSDTDIVEVQLGGPLVEDDIERYDWDWE